jgi:CHASE2 domain-containing sensor protein
MTSSELSIDVGERRDRRADAALILGILAVPGGTLAWDIPGVGGWPFIAGAVVGLVLGVMAWRENRARRALIGAILCTLMILFTLVFLVGSG